jgi:hypothetical protein
MDRQHIHISLNPLSEYVYASDSRKDRIIKEQKRPSKLMIVPYTTARAGMKRFFKDGFSIVVITNAIEFLHGKRPIKDFWKNDRKNSIEALRTFLKLQVPDFKNLKCSFTTKNNKFLVIDNVEIRIAPDLIIRGIKDGQPFVGGIKFHISKGQQFSNEQGILAASAIKLFLLNEVAIDEEEVNPDLCLSIDIFGERITPAPINHKGYEKLIRDACEDLKKRW